MKKLIPLLLIALLTLATSCTAKVPYKTPFETGGKTYKIALLPWKTYTMSFDIHYRWTMVQALTDACKQSGAFDLTWSAYPFKGESANLDLKSTTPYWIKQKYNRLVPNVDAVKQATANTDADLAMLYIIDADPSDSGRKEAGSSINNSIRVFLVDLKTNKVTENFIRTNFIQKRALTDSKQLNLRLFNKYLNNEN